MAIADKPKSFAEFWPRYLLAHRNPRCRALHFAGTTGAAAGIAAAALTADPAWAVAGVIFAYALAWTGHFASEGNRPATLTHPIWSLLGDIRMYLLWISGRLQPLLEAVETVQTASKTSLPMHGQPTHSKTGQVKPN